MGIYYNKEKTNASRCLKHFLILKELEKLVDGVTE